MNSIRKRFNIIDFAVIIIILGCIAGLIVRYNLIERVVNAVDNDPVSVNFIAKELSPEIAEAVENGQEYYLVDSDIYLGKINNIKVSDAERVYADENGQAAVGIDSTARELIGNFTLKGAKTEKGFLLDGVEYLAPGKELVIRCDDLILSVIITEIK